MYYSKIDISKKGLFDPLHCQNIAPNESLVGSFSRLSFLSISMIASRTKNSFRKFDWKKQISDFSVKQIIGMDILIRFVFIVCRLYLLDLECNL